MSINTDVFEKVKIFEFVLNDAEKIVIESEIPAHQINCCDFVEIYFLKDNAPYLLREDTLRSDMYVLKVLLDKALSKKLYLHSSIKKDIGYLCNEEWAGRPGLVYKKLEGRDYWVGDSHLLWCGSFNTWLYNEKESGDIIFHMTPVYPDHFEIEDEVEAAALYDAWISKYQSFFTTTISPEVARRWLAQADNILQQIDQNVEREKLEYEARRENGEQQEY